MDITYRPMKDTSWMRESHERTFSRFNADWNTTLRQLKSEIEHLDGTNVVIEIDAHPDSFRVDGKGLKAGTHFFSPGVIVSFDSKHGPLRYRADGLEARWYNQQDWRHNVRAVALTLEMLRAIDRYGGVGGQQYGGYLELEAEAGMTAAAAKEVLYLHAGHRAGGGYTVRDTYRMARANAHPDRNGGDRTKWDQVEAAGKVLGL